MKKIGLVGGIGPASTVEYYLGIIEKCQKEQGNDIYPEIIIDSVDMSLCDRALVEKYVYVENADSLLLGCTELPLAIKAGDVSVPVLNTTEIHIGEIYRNAM